MEVKVGVWLTKQFVFVNQSVMVVILLWEPSTIADIYYLKCDLKV